MKAKWIDFKPFNASLQVVDLEWWLVNAPKKNLPNAELEEWAGVGGSFYALPLVSGGTIFVMVLGEYEEEVIYHEALHAAFIMLDSVGVRVTADNHESMTYAQSYLVSEIKKKFYGMKPQPLKADLMGHFLENMAAAEEAAAVPEPASDTKPKRKPKPKPKSTKETNANAYIHRFTTL